MAVSFFRLRQAEVQRHLIGERLLYIVFKDLFSPARSFSLFVQQKEEPEGDSPPAQIENTQTSVPPFEKHRGSGSPGPLNGHPERQQKMVDLMSALIILSLADAGNLFLPRLFLLNVISSLFILSPLCFA